MGESDSHPTLGQLIWESPTAQPAPKPISYIISGLFMLMAIGLAFGVLPMLFNARDAADRNGGIAGGVVVLGLAAAAVWIFRRARNPQKLLGVQFFQHGLEFGPMSRRRSVAYEELESIHFEPHDIGGDQRDRASAGARLALSLVAGNPAGIGYAMAKLNAERIESFAVIKLVNEPEFRIAIFEGVGKVIEAAVHNKRLAA